MFTRLAIRSLVPVVNQVTKVIVAKEVKQCAYYSSFSKIKPVSVSQPSYISRRLFSEKEAPALVVDYDYVRSSIGDSEKLIIDVREPDELKEHGKIPNSVNIPLGDVTSALSTMSEKCFKSTYGRNKPTEDTEIIFYCMIGKRSSKAQQSAYNLGYKNAKNYIGSWTEWSSKQEPKK